MAKALSQDEIDILLEVRDQFDGATAGVDMDSIDTIIATEERKKVTDYNFKRPRLFSQDQMRLLNHVHEAFARDLSVYLSAQLRTIVDISLTAVDQVLYSEYVMSSAPPSCLFVVDVVETDHLMVFELDPRLVLFTIEKLFGGPGEFSKRPREISQIEQRIMSKVIGRAFRELEKAWTQIHKLKLREKAFESNAEFVQIIPGVEPALVVTMAVTVYEQRSFINICYPYILLEKMLGRTSIKQWFSSTQQEVDPRVRKRYEASVRNTIVEMRAELGRTSLPITELMRLQVGDVIPLQCAVTDPATVYIGDKQKYRALMGKTGKRRALRIAEVIPSSLDPDHDETTAV